MKEKGKLHSTSGSGPDMVEQAEVVVVVVVVVVMDSDGAEVVLELEMPVLEDDGVAETPEMIANMKNDKHKKNKKNQGQTHLDNFLSTTHPRCHILLQGKVILAAMFQLQLLNREHKQG